MEQMANDLIRGEKKMLALQFHLLKVLFYKIEYEHCDVNLIHFEILAVTRTKLQPYFKKRKRNRKTNPERWVKFGLSVL